MHRSASSHRLPSRPSVVVGASIAALAGAVVFAASGVSASAPPSEPPSPEPASSEPSDGDTTFTVPEPSGDLELDRRAVTEAVVLLGRLDDIPFDRDCVAAIADQLPAADVPLVLAEMAASAVDSAMPDVDLPDFTLPDMELPDFTLPDLDLSDMTIPDIELPGGLTLPDIELPTLTMPDIELPDLTFPDIDLPTLSLPDVSIPEMSDEAEALGEQLIYCVAGDADPALVGQAVDAIVASPQGADIDAECASAVLTAFPDSVLQAIIDADGELLAFDDLPEDDTDKAFLLFACTDFDDTAD